MDICCRESGSPGCSCSHAMRGSKRRSKENAGNTRDASFADIIVQVIEARSALISVRSGLDVRDSHQMKTPAREARRPSKAEARA